MTQRFLLTNNACDAKLHEDLETGVLVHHQDPMSIRWIPAQITEDCVVLDGPQAGSESWQPRIGVRGGHLPALNQCGLRNVMGIAGIGIIPSKRSCVFN